MSASRLSLTAAIVFGIIVAAVLPSDGAAQGNRQAQTVKSPPDTLPPYKSVRGVSRNKSGHVAAAIDALQGDSGLPAPLLLKHYHREGRSVVLDMKADTLPRIRFEGAGGTVRILGDGRRVIVARHN